MRLYFLRHAAALDGVDDAQRPLSPQGRAQAQKLGQLLRRSGVVFDLAFTSPLVRAQQTVALVLKLTNASPPIPVQTTPVLLNETSAATFAAWLTQLPPVGQVLLVGHEPSLSARVRRLLGLERAEALELAKGAVACVKTVDQRTGSLKFLLTPKALGLDGTSQP